MLRQFQAHLSRAKLPRIRFHDLRHSAATFLLLQGVADRTVMEILGHTSLAMTSRYVHVLDGLKRDAAEQMDRLFTVYDACLAHVHRLTINCTRNLTVERETPCRTL